MGTGVEKSTTLSPSCRSKLPTTNHWKRNTWNGETKSAEAGQFDRRVQYTSRYFQSSIIFD